mmetsp:Transcript_49028/g.106790  ORF Transcript_49028/g.106790 Transcript_49028/m.106790 type:complete len:271 (+) Transcript_49028:133-945(+)
MQEVFLTTSLQQLHGLLDSLEVMALHRLHCSCQSLELQFLHSFCLLDLVQLSTSHKLEHFLSLGDRRLFAVLFRQISLEVRCGTLVLFQNNFIVLQSLDGILDSLNSGFELFQDRRQRAIHGTHLCQPCRTVFLSLHLLGIQKTAHLYGKIVILRCMCQQKFCCRQSVVLRLLQHRKLLGHRRVLERKQFIEQHIITIFLLVLLHLFVVLLGCLRELLLLLGQLRLPCVQVGHCRSSLFHFSIFRSRIALQISKYVVHLVSDILGASRNF